MKPETTCWVTDAKADIDSLPIMNQLHELDCGPLIIRIGVNGETNLDYLIDALDAITEAVLARRDRRDEAEAAKEQARRDKAAEAAA